MSKYHRLILGAWIASAACSGGVTHNVTGPAPTKGELVIVVTNQGGHTGTVRITGPQGYSLLLTATDSLFVPAGQYSVTATTDTLADPIVASFYVPTITHSPANVSVGDHDTVTVTYGTRPGSGMVWLAGGGQLDGYTSSQLASGGSLTPQVQVTANFVTNSFGAAFDTAGALWVANGAGDIVGFPPALLGTTGAANPYVHFYLNAAAAPRGLAFDPQGNLWVGYFNSPGVVEFSAAQLHGSGAMNAAVTIFLPNVYGLAFDQQGNLWVAADSLLCFTPSQQAAGGTITPAITVTLSNAKAIGGIAFDTAGNLWTNGIASVFEITKAQLAASGTVATPVLLTGTPAAQAEGLAFDASGDLWLSSFTALFEYTPSQLTSSGAPDPTVSIPNAIGSGAIAFDVHSSRLPLR